MLLLLKLAVCHAAIAELLFAKQQLGRLPVGQQGSGRLGGLVRLIKGMVPIGHYGRGAGEGHCEGIECCCLTKVVVWLEIVVMIVVGGGACGEGCCGCNGR